MPLAGFDPTGGLAGSFTLLESMPVCRSCRFYIAGDDAGVPFLCLCTTCIDAVCADVLLFEILSLFPVAQRSGTMSAPTSAPDLLDQFSMATRWNMGHREVTSAIDMSQCRRLYPAFRRSFPTERPTFILKYSRSQQLWECVSIELEPTFKGGGDWHFSTDR